MSTEESLPGPTPLKESQVAFWSMFEIRYSLFLFAAQESKEKLVVHEYDEAGRKSSSLFHLRPEGSDESFFMKINCDNDGVTSVEFGTPEYYRIIISKEEGLGWQSTEEDVIPDDSQVRVYQAMSTLLVNPAMLSFPLN